MRRRPLSVGNLLTAWALPALGTLHVTSWGSRCSGCAHPDGSFNLMDFSPWDLGPSCSLSLPAGTVQFLDFARDLSRTLEPDGVPVSELLGVSPYLGHSAALPWPVKAASSRAEAMLREALAARSLEMREYVEFVGMDLSPAPLSLVHLVSHEGFSYHTRIFSTLFEEVFFCAPRPGTEEAAYLLPQGALEWFWALDRSSVHCAREAVVSVSSFLEADRPLLEVAATLAPELGFARAWSTAQAVGV